MLAIGVALGGTLLGRDGDLYLHVAYGRPVLAVWLIFFISGVLHEYVLNLTLWIVTGKKLFGTMMLYFLLQGAGVLAERRFLSDHPRVNRLFTWLVVFAPVPLVFHESMLRALHLWPTR